jgi:hypothetical protein
MSSNLDIYLCSECVQFVWLKLVIMSKFLLELAQELNCGTSLLLHSKSKSKLWKNIFKHKVTIFR